METVAESRCCQQLEQGVATIEAGVHSCIRDHSGSESDCLAVLVLWITYLSYNKQYGDLQQDAVPRILAEYPSQEYGGFHKVQNCLSIGRHPLALKRFLCSSKVCALSSLSILDTRVDDSCSGSGMSALDLVHSSTNLLYRVINVLWRNTIQIHLPKYVKYHVNNTAVFIVAFKYAAVHLWNKDVSTRYVRPLPWRSVGPLTAWQCPCS